MDFEEIARAWGARAAERAWWDPGDEDAFVEAIVDLQPAWQRSGLMATFLRSRDEERERRKAA